MLAVTGVFLLAVFLGAMYLVLGASEQFSREVGVEGEDSNARLKVYLEERERASAYAAVRDHLDQRREEPGIAAVFCRDSRHRWINGQIEFQGDVDFQGEDGRMHRHTYTALLSGSARDGWEVESVRVSPAPRGAGPSRP